jgi:hypothetical protein
VAADDSEELRLAYRQAAVHVAAKQHRERQSPRWQLEACRIRTDKRPNVL